MAQPKLSYCSLIRWSAKLGSKPRGVTVGMRLKLNEQYANTFGRYPMILCYPNGTEEFFTEADSRREAENLMYLVNRAMDRQRGAKPQQ